MISERSETLVPGSPVRLTKLSAVDFQSAYAVYGNEDTMRYAYLNRFASEESFRPYFQKLVEQTEDPEGNWVAYVVREAAKDGMTEGALVGIADFELYRLPEGACNAEIGYFLVPGMWGKGYGTSVGRMLLDICFGEYGVHKVQASCHAENEASQRLLQKCGMVLEGRLREQRLKNGRWVDEIKFGMTYAEWHSAY